MIRHTLNKCVGSARIEDRPMKKGGILLIEDDDSIREYTEDMLRQEGYQVLAAANGKAALDILEKLDFIPKVILLDLQMPVMDGWQFMERKKANRRLEHIPVVAFSALEDRKISAAKTDDVIKKPLNPELMLQVIGKYFVEDARSASAQG